MDDRLLPYANATVQHYQARFQSGKSITDQLFALRQILGLKINEQKTKYMIAAQSTSTVEPPFTPDKMHHSQDLDLPSPALRQ
jgi:hypothetical protein